MKLASLLDRLVNCPRFIPLMLALLAARIAALLPPRQRAAEPWGVGISVLIPESGTPELLDATLAHAEAALAQVQEPGEIIVLVNGAPTSLYQTLQARYPAVQWHFHADALGFNGAIEAGLACVQYPAVYLLNSDMRLAPDALRQLLGYRYPGAFALASQIFFPPGVRREETGWSDYYDKGGRTLTYEREPDGSPLARGTLYASGGSSLFKTALLRQYVRESRDYSPFYWEDADWGVRAWADGLECLFVPASTAVHEHRGTIKRRFSAEEIGRIVDRNGLLFELRNHLSWLDGLSALIHLSGRPAKTRQELGSLAVACGVFRVRRQSLARQRRGFDYRWQINNHYSGRAIDPALPVVLWVTPFAVLPPAHGGARRIVELARALVGRVNLILLSDEQVSYRMQDWRDFALFQNVRLLQGRKDRSGATAGDLPTRMRTHAPPLLRQTLRELQRVHRIDLVQVEFMEGARLVDERVGSTPFVASLHDVYLDGGRHDVLQRQLLARFDSVVACSDEDAVQLGDIPHVVVPNGATDRLATALPSLADSSMLLFMGPFRYQPNYDGILAFLRECWPAIRAACPTASITILAGVESTRPEYASALLQQAGVNLVSAFVDPSFWLHHCALTINPQQAIRGSALKVAESILARRICVSTREGTRGFSDLDGQALQVADSWQAMAQGIIHLLQNVDARHALEASGARDRHRLSWQGQAARLLGLYATLIPGFKP